MQYPFEVQQLVEAKTGIRLETTDLTSVLITYGTDARGHRCQLFGPFMDLDAEDPTLRIFVSVSQVLGESTSLQFLVQDCEDDWLNSNAYGAEKYNRGAINA